MKYILGLGLMVIMGIITYLGLTSNKPFKLIKNSETPAFIEEVVQELNHDTHFNDQKFLVYTAGFGVFDKIPKLTDAKDKAILWLGGYPAADLNNAEGYKLVIVSSAAMLNYLAKRHIRAFLQPIGAIERGVSNIRKGTDWIVIGNPDFAEDILKNKHLSFKSYSWKETLKNPQVFHNVRAVIAEDPYIETKNFNLPTVMFELAQAEIPILAQWKGEGSFSLLYQFNDNISFYLYKDDANHMIDEMKEMSDDIKERLNLNKEFTNRYFSLRNAVSNIKNLVLYEKPIDEMFAEKSMAISLRTDVGYYGSGEYWLAQDIKDYIKKNNYTGHIVFANSVYDERSEIHLKLRGSITDKDVSSRSNTDVLWQIYPEIYPKGADISKENYLKIMVSAMQGNDVLVSASKDIAFKMKEMGYNAYYLPQFTNTHRFYRDFDEGLKSEVLFVGNYHFRRDGIVWAVTQGLPVTIYGDRYPRGMAKAKYIDNRILRKYYSSAKIVLNDTMPLMKKLGFISNRIFDATACGSLVISDYMKEIEDIYGDSVPMYKTPEELVELVNYYLEHENERFEKAKRAREITLKNFSADKVLRELNQIIQRTKQGQP